ncbi:SOS response-associated peptidase [Falsochrobactrum shanghaiense]|uniref:Abasic site processing protein n=1 Tax=Falsochrobactrum shanghaiense TaxID=2201899 RepID=A0A316JSF4_9HYPH|nr:SOS response-associated peptidase [Falsochrobactrum shanghaiense]PWL18190.1 SOS response-associated peptidase [Falsochrobactrum shanghaiense]
MCGRFSLTASREEVEALLGAMIAEDFPPRYNIAPTQPILSILAGETPPPGSNRPDRAGLLVRWGFVPSWVKNPNDWPLVFNIRSETAAEKNSFRAALNHRRALVPASGFYEWRRVGKNKSQPYWIRPRNGGIVAFGALVETWSSADGSQIDTAGLLTTSANNLLRPIHARMPVVVQPEDFARWLDCKNFLPKEVADIMRPVQDDFFEVIPVSDKVNNVANTSPDLQARVEEDLTAEPAQPKRKKSSEPEADSGDQLSMF